MEDPVASRSSTVMRCDNYGIETSTSRSAETVYWQSGGTGGLVSLCAAFARRIRRVRDHTSDGIAEGPMA